MPRFARIDVYGRRCTVDFFSETVRNLAGVESTLLTTSISIWLSIIFLLIGAVNVWLILQSSARVRDAKASSRLIAAHRVGGYLFIGLFLVMAYFMVSRLGEVGSSTSPAVMIHLTLAMVLSPLLFVKVLVARYYKSYYSFLTPIGLTIFVLSFVLIGITAGPYLAHQVRMQTVTLDAIDLPPAVIDMNLAAETMQKRCSKCHNLDRVLAARKDTPGWLATVRRMQSLPDSGISEQDAQVIVSYLAFQMKPQGSAATVSLEVDRAVVDQHCGRCHSLDRVYKTAETPKEWSETVARMVRYAADSSNAFQPGEDQQIIRYLSATQTPDSFERRKAQALANSSVSQNLIPQRGAAVTTAVKVSRHDGKMIGFLSFVTLGALTLILRRPGRSLVTNMKPKQAVTSLQDRVEAIRATPSFSSKPLILRLASITQQTHDAKTLRFIVAEDQKFSARPGQFLTFSFLFDGKRVTRSYSICSSTARSGYVEITPKRISQGCVSVFLNDRASVGMTVEANGPFGQFYFDGSKHRNVVLLAAGSGITPMIAILRYMDDLCLETTVILLYCVRTRNDIIFHNELEELKIRLKNFQYHLLLSQPDAEWSGPRGHVSREFVKDKVEQHEVQDFFLCGPPAFMDASRCILTGIGVKPDRIKEESFGSAVPKSLQPDSAATQPRVIVEFVRSSKTCLIRSGQSLLEAAEEHGVDIPFSCRQGQCGTCKTKLLEGNVRMDAEEGLDPDSKAQGFVLTCVGHARGLVKLDA